MQSSSDRIDATFLWTPNAWIVAVAPTYTFVTQKNGKASEFKTWLPHIDQNASNFTLEQYVLFCFDAAACDRLPALRSAGETVIAQLYSIAERRLKEWTVAAELIEQTRRMSYLERMTHSYNIQKMLRITIEEADETSNSNPKAKSKATNLKSAKERYQTENMLQGRSFQSSEIAAREVVSRLCFKLLNTTRFGN